MPKILQIKPLKKLLPARPRNAHKGLFGHVLVVGGDHGMAGAVRLAGEAALRVGAGLVSVATRSEHINTVSSDRPELMCHAVHHPNDLQKLIARSTVIVLGPGLGQSAWSQELFNTVLMTTQAKVIDADGLNLLAHFPRKRDDWILTPHAGEAARLLECTSEQIQKDRDGSVKKLQTLFGGVSVLKGAGSLIATDNSMSICKAGNPGMASGGMGDVLSGVIGALLAQGLNLQQAAEMGVCLHASAGDLAAKASGQRGLIASDLMLYLRKLMN